MKPKLREKRGIDRVLLSVTLLLTIIGLVAVADASAPQALNTFGNKYYFAGQQVRWFLGGLAIMLILIKVDYRLWKKVATPLFFLNFLLLLIVLVPGVGIKTYGARRWIDLGFLSFQPSELTKFSLILYFAKLTQSGKKLLAYIIPLALVCLLIMAQPDLGTTMVIAIVGLTQIFLAGFPVWYFALILIGSGLLSSFLILISDYRKQRFLTFLKQGTDPLGSDYHIRQILYSLGLGGIFGAGLGASRQKFLFLPEASTDSIFAIIAEEIGFIGAFALIIIFLIYVFRALRIALRSDDLFAKLLAVGIASWIGAQTIINIGSMTALVPLTGVPLPFISYGGTSLVAVMAATGILLNISSQTNDKKKKY